MSAKICKKWYQIGFDCGEYFNGVASALTLKAAKELAVEVEREYGEAPVIRVRRPHDGLN